jgi:hypothetical protein
VTTVNNSGAFIQNIKSRISLLFQRLAGLGGPGKLEIIKVISGSGSLFIIGTGRDFSSFIRPLWIVQFGAKRDLWSSFRMPSSKYPESISGLRFRFSDKLKSRGLL